MVTSAASFSALLPLGLRLVYLSDVCTVYPETAVCTLLRTYVQRKKSFSGNYTLCRVSAKELVKWSVRVQSKEPTINGIESLQNTWQLGL